MNSEDDADDRTRRAARIAGASASLEPLAARRIVIELTPDTANSQTAALAFLTVCNLATRLGVYLPNLDVAVPQAPAFDSLVYPPVARLRDQALWTLREATRTEHLHRGERDNGIYDLAIVVGEQAVVPARERIFVGWDGWTGVVDSKPNASSEENRIGALIAAAMSVARLHSHQLKILGASIPDLAGEWRLNALTLDTGSATANLPTQIDGLDTLLIGGGALGSTFTYLLTHIRELRASVVAVDYDVLKVRVHGVESGSPRGTMGIDSGRST